MGTSRRTDGVGRGAGGVSGENKPFAALIVSLSGSLMSRKVFVYNMAFVGVIFPATV